MDASKIDLSKPAWGPNAQKPEDLVEKPTDSQPEENKVEAAPVEPVESVEETEEQKVPYSRFKKFHDRALQAEAEAAEWRSKAQRSLEPERESESEVPGYWKELYGDSDASLRAWKINERAQQELIEKAEARALEAVQSERQQETERVRSNEELIDQNLEALQDYAGHQLSEREQSAILDIVDEYTPKDDDGNYLGATIPFEKAWDIYELKQQVSKAPRNQSRDRVAALNSSQSQGEPNSDQQEKNTSWNPLDWSAYKKRL